jgi:hypothetical protein
MTRPTPKIEQQRATSAFARGGKTRMLGKGNRTLTATPDARRADVGADHDEVEGQPAARQGWPSS